MIKINSQCNLLDKHYDSFSLFDCLTKKYADNELFLLESLSGPKKDRNQAAIGFNPIFGIEVFRKTIKLKGLSPLLQLAEEKLLEDPALTKKESNSYEMALESNIWPILRKLEALFELHYSGEKMDIRFGFFGYIGYDAIHAIEEIPYSIPDEENNPVISFNIYQGIFNIDLKENKSYLTLNNSDAFAPLSHSELINFVAKNYREKPPINLEKITAPEAIYPSVKKAEYLKWVDKALYHVGIGDVYQIQFGHEINITSSIKPFDVYRRLRAINPSPYMYYAELSGQHIIGASPELFLRIDEKNKVTIRPIAGTIKVGKTPEENQRLQDELRNDKKEKAEHIMLVDLARNDIGRICQPGTMCVDELMIIEQYSHVSHLVSNVFAIKEERYDKYDVIAASFPAGTMAGSPKVRAMELIEENEKTRRGIYAGCLGFIGFNGIVETALCIRTAVYKNGVYTIRASGGIVLDSTPLGEWNETISKLSAGYYAITNTELRDEDFVN